MSLSNSVRQQRWRDRRKAEAEYRRHMIMPRVYLRHCQVCDAYILDGLPLCEWCAIRRAAAVLHG